MTIYKCLAKQHFHSRHISFLTNTSESIKNHSPFNWLILSICLFLLSVSSALLESSVILMRYQVTIFYWGLLLVIAYCTVALVPQINTRSKAQINSRYTPSNRPHILILKMYCQWSTGLFSIFKSSIGFLMVCLKRQMS